MVGLVCATTSGPGHMFYVLVKKVREYGRLHLPRCPDPFSVLPCLTLCPRRFTLWDGITRLDSGNRDRVGEEKKHEIERKVEKTFRKIFFYQTFLFWYNYA